MPPATGSGVLHFSALFFCVLCVIILCVRVHTQPNPPTLMDIEVDNVGAIEEEARTLPLSSPSIVPLGPADVSLPEPVTLCKAGDRFFMWDGSEVARLRYYGRVACTAIGSCPTKSSTRGKAAALPVMLSDEESSALVGAGWARVVDATGEPIDASALLAAGIAGDPTGIRAQRRLVWRDLWSRGYCLTNGIKFGCDFLCYRADPTAVHAAFMVVVLKEGSGVRPLSLTAVARVATTALKIAVVAWADPLAGTVRYSAFKRMGPGTAIFADAQAAIIETLTADTYPQQQETIIPSTDASGVHVATTELATELAPL